MDTHLVQKGKLEGGGVGGGGGKGSHKTPPAPLGHHGGAVLACAYNLRSSEGRTQVGKPCALVCAQHPHFRVDNAPGTIHPTSLQGAGSRTVPALYLPLHFARSQVPMLALLTKRQACLEGPGMSAQHKGRQAGRDCTDTRNKAGRDGTDARNKRRNTRMAMTATQHVGSGCVEAIMHAHVFFLQPPSLNLAQVPGIGRGNFSRV
eukprot:scaffold105243_cov17-Tisochrysis_lutea.AAC.1